MKWILWRIAQWVKYRTGARGITFIHSPFVFAFCRDVLYDQRYFYAFDQIEKIRNQLLRNKTAIRKIDYGAGSIIKRPEVLSVGEITRTTSIPPKYGRLLFRMMLHYKPAHVIELGTSLGISTAYLASGNPQSKVVSVEGDPELARLARQNLQRCRIDNAAVLNGTFQQSLPDILKEMGKVDFVLLDGDHRKNATLLYFDLCARYATENTIIVLDDIYWNKEMYEAWREITSDQRISIAIDLYRLGIVFFKKGIARQYFTLRY